MVVVKMKKKNDVLEVGAGKQKWLLSLTSDLLLLPQSCQLGHLTLLLLAVTLVSFLSELFLCVSFRLNLASNRIIAD